MKVLVVEDDLALSDVLSFTLRRAGYEVVAAYDGLAALEYYDRDEPDLLILDLNLPGLDGLSVCRQIRTKGETPIIILSVRDGDEAVVRGLEMGADDYIVKPFSPTQLIARIRAVLRRAGVSGPPAMLETGGLALDRSRNELRSGDGQPIRLTPLEVRLLEGLMLHPGQVLPGETLITTVWGPAGGDRAMLKQLVYRLRAKMESGGVQNAGIETVPGIGYALNTDLSS
ncbi:MAG: response regulator transcription factor [Chloroflexota bacterium]